MAAPGMFLQPQAAGFPCEVEAVLPAPPTEFQPSVHWLSSGHVLILSQSQTRDRYHQLTDQKWAVGPASKDRTR